MTEWEEMRVCGRRLGAARVEGGRGDRKSPFATQGKPFEAQGKPFATQGEQGSGAGALQRALFME